MIPILYESNETRFETNGLGLLADCVSFLVTEERNGQYEAEFQYPISGINFDEIKVGRFVACTHDERGDVQPFIIYKKTVPDVNGIVTFNAYHISYLLSNIIVLPFEAGSVYGAMSGIKTFSANNNPFTFWTNKPNVKDFKFTVPRLARNILGGEDNSILDVYDGGEYEFDKFEVRLYENRGKDSGVTIRYGINLANLSQEIDNAGTYNAVAPYWQDAEGNAVYLPEGVVVMDEAQGSRVDALPLDLSDKFTDKVPTVDELRQMAKNSIASGKAWQPTENLKVEFYRLWETEEFAEFADLQSVSLCDTVTVIYPVLGISEVKQKVIRTVYDVLLERYDSIELGVLQTSLGKAIQSAVLEVVPTKEEVRNTVRLESDLLRGGLGGYVVMPPGEHRYPEEILIMDSPDKETAQNVWRWNKQGIGYSPNGYHGPFTTAWTIDGQFVADFIKAGALADKNRNTVLDLETGSLTFKKGLIRDTDGNNSWNLDTGVLTAEKGFIGDFTLNNGELIHNTDTAYVAISDDGLKFLNNVTYSDPDYLARGGVGVRYSGITFYDSSRSTSWENVSDVASIVQGRLPNDRTKFALAFSINGSPYFTILEGFDQPNYFWQSAFFARNLVVSGTKSRSASTKTYSDRLLFAYETPTPLFGDIGQATLDEEGICYVEVDDIFSETVSDRVEYQVFLQAEGDGKCFVSDKNPRYFVINGTPGLRVAWELKAKQRGYEMSRLEFTDNGLEEYAQVKDENDFVNYVNQQEGLLYGEY